MDDRSITVLLIEDDAEDVRWFRQALAGVASPSCVITPAGRLDSALHYLDEANFDCIVLDLGLSDKPGLDTFARVHERAAQTPTIVLTGGADEILGLQMVRGGAQDYLVKGQFDGNLLARAIRYAIERKRVQEGLRKSEERWRTYINTANDLIFALDPAGSITSANQAVYAATGYQEHELLGRSVLEVIAPESYAAAAEALAKILNQESVEEAAVEAIAKDGRRLTLEIRGRMLYEEGKFAGTFHIARDVSERKRAEEAVRENESRLRAILDSVQAGVLILDPETHTIVDVNPAAANLIGAPREAIIGSVCHEFVCPAEVGRCPITDLGYTVDNAERVLLTADGTNRPIMKTVSRIMLGGRPHLLESFTDITERKQAEEALRESEVRYRAISSLTSDLAYAYRVEPDATLVNLWATGALERLAGFTTEELRAHGGWQALILPEDMPIPESQFLALLAGQEKVVEYRLVTQGGAVRWVRDYARPEWDAEQGRTVAIYGAMQDITERKRAEAQLQASLQEKEMLLKEIHHRVKNNLQVVSSLLALQADSVTDPQVRQMFHDSRSRLRAMSLIHERLYRAQNLASIDAGEYVRDLVAYLFSIYSDPARVIRSYVHVDDLALGIDTAIPCGLLLTELVSNVLKHAYPPEWGREGRIDVGLHAAREGWLALTVGDDGVGLAASFDLKQPQSLGLQLVNLLAGQIKGTVELDRSAGTAFRITFPHVER